MKNTVTKKWGLGSLSFPISIFAIMLSFSFVYGKTLGRIIFDSLGVPFPYGLISLLLLVIALLLSSKYKDHKFSKAGMILSKVVISLILISSIFAIIL